MAKSRRQRLKDVRDAIGMLGQTQKDLVNLKDMATQLLTDVRRAIAVLRGEETALKTED